jgi:hypothetical protein
MKDNKPIDGAMADRVKIMAKENHFTLELPSCSADDGGQYTCRVSDATGGSVTCSAHLEVHNCKYKATNWGMFAAYVLYFTLMTVTHIWSLHGHP